MMNFATLLEAVGVYLPMVPLLQFIATSAAVLVASTAFVVALKRFVKLLNPLGPVAKGIHLSWLKQRRHMRLCVREYKSISILSISLFVSYLIIVACFICALAFVVVAGSFFVQSAGSDTLKQVIGILCTVLYGLAGLQIGTVGLSEGWRVIRLRKFGYKAGLAVVNR